MSYVTHVFKGFVFFIFCFLKVIYRLVLEAIGRVGLTLLNIWVASLLINEIALSRDILFLLLFPLLLAKYNHLKDGFSEEHIVKVFCIIFCFYLCIFLMMPDYPMTDTTIFGPFGCVTETNIKISFYLFIPVIFLFELLTFFDLKGKDGKKPYVLSNGEIIYVKRKE